MTPPQRAPHATATLAPPGPLPRLYQQLGRYVRSLRVLARLSLPGLITALLLFAASLTPSLLPRTPGFQGMLSGLSLALGYAVATAVVALGTYLGFRVRSPRARRALRSTGRILLTVTGVLGAVCLWRATTWQNAVRQLMGMELVDGVQPIRVAIVAVTVFMVCLLVARLLAGAFHVVAARFRRFLPPRVGNLLGLVSVGVGVWALSDGVIFKFGLRAADASFQEIDALIEDELVRPTDPTRSGSDASYVDWHDLGKQGRLFVTAGPSADEISAFVGTTARQPIRVYAGLNAAPTPGERAQLALRELQRVDAFSRSVLVVATPTGTGWLDPGAMNSIEYLHRGDIAIVSAQYSYLPSALSLATEGAYGAEMAKALFEEVYNYWSTLPRTARPRLYLFGLSLGALNAHQSFDLHDILSDPFHGAMWVGMPFRSALLREITATRDPDSPAWLPRFRNGSVVRFMNQHGGLREHASNWGPLRIAYIQYASDPVTFFSLSSFLREPEWMRAPRGPDVTPLFRWYPIVTGLQLVADIAAGVGATPPGFGHNFLPAHYIDAWHALTEPEGWSDDDIRRLKQRFADAR